MKTVNATEKIISILASKRQWIEARKAVEAKAPPAKSEEKRQQRENHDACVADVRQEHGKLRRYMMLTKCLWELTCQMSTIFVKVFDK